MHIAHHNMIKESYDVRFDQQDPIYKQGVRGTVGQKKNPDQKNS